MTGWQRIAKALLLAWVMAAIAAKSLVIVFPTLDPTIGRSHRWNPVLSSLTVVRELQSAPFSRIATWGCLLGVLFGMVVFPLGLFESAGALADKVLPAGAGWTMLYTVGISLVLFILMPRLLWLVATLGVSGARRSDG